MEKIIRYNKHTVLNINHCKCGGDWFHAATLIKFNPHDNKSVWICDNCGAIYERNVELQKIVVTDESNEINLANE